MFRLEDALLIRTAMGDGLCGARNERRVKVAIGVSKTGYSAQSSIWLQGTNMPGLLVTQAAKKKRSVDRSARAIEGDNQHQGT